MAALVGRNVPPVPGLAPDADLPQEYCEALLNDHHTEIRPDCRSTAAAGLKMMWHEA